MKIAILGWGSLVWDSRELPIKDGWHEGGPVLPIEFSRVSKDCRLTLVIDPTNGAEVTTQFSLSKRKELEDAICDLRAREGTKHEKIGFVITNSNESNCKVMPEAEPLIRDWTREKKFDAVIWTDLCPNFEDQTKKDFTIGNAARYLEGLPKGAKKEARKYIRKAPKAVTTPLRKKLLEDGWLEETDK